MRLGEGHAVGAAQWAGCCHDCLIRDGEYG
jgi:hypothetical protein